MQQRLHVLGSLFLCACAASAANSKSAAPPKPPPPAVESPEPAPPPPGPKGQILITKVTNGVTPYLGVIDREGLQAVVDQGLGRLLARLKVSPVIEHGHFQGFRVVGLDSAWNGAGIFLDDIITRLNGQPIERPEQAQAAFESLRVASEISLDMMREGKPKKLRYQIESRVNNE